MILDRITIESDKMAGQPCIRGLRIPVATVVAMVADGMTTAEIFADLPELEVEDVAQALRYAAAAVRKRELPLRHPGEVLGRREPFATIGGQPDRGRARRVHVTDLGMSRATDLEILEVADRDDRDRRPSIAEPRIGAAAELSSLHRSRVG